MALVHSSTHTPVLSNPSQVDSPSHCLTGEINGALGLESKIRLLRLVTAPLFRLLGLLLLHRGWAGEGEI